MHIYAHAKILRRINAESFLLLEFTGSSAHAARRMRSSASPGARVVIDPLECIEKGNAEAPPFIKSFEVR